MKLRNLAVLVWPVLAWSPTSFAGMVLDRVEATVNSELVLLSDVVDARRTLELRKQLDPLFSGTSLATKGKSAQDDEMVSLLVGERLIAQKFPTKDDEVESEIQSIQAANHIDRSMLKQALTGQGFQFSDYFELTRLLVSKKSLIREEIQPKVFISDSDIKNYFYNHHQESNRAGFEYRVQMMTFASKADSEHAREFVQAGNDFEETAKKMSEQGSDVDLGYLTEKEMAPVIKGVIRKMKVGEMSNPLQAGPQTFIVVKLLDIRSGKENELKRLKNDIQIKLASEEYSKQLEVWFAQSKQNAYIHIAGEPSFLTSK